MLKFYIKLPDWFEIPTPPPWYIYSLLDYITRKIGIEEL